MNCSTCGTSLAADARFCPNCGATVSHGAPIVPVSAPPPPASSPVGYVSGRVTPAGGPRSTLAVVSLASAIGGWTVVPCLGGIAAVITGHMARAEIRRSGGTLGGDSMALAGLIIGYASFAGACLLTAFATLFWGAVSAYAHGQVH